MLDKTPLTITIALTEDVAAGLDRLREMCNYRTLEEAAAQILGLYTCKPPRHWPKPARPTNRPPRLLTKQ